MSEYSFDAVIFDLDGVITRTATIHAESWKAVFDEYLRYREKEHGEKFREFTHEDDYLPYVDGKPRYEGVKSFLESRGVDIPYGEPADPAERETVCGVGNRKNTVFCNIIKERGAEIYSSTIDFVKSLKDAGIRVGIASSSKNCRLILRSVGIEDLFETRVDGVVSAEMGLKGKPEGDIFVTAARNMGALPAGSVVVEDATSGVQAGRNGGFGMVIGVARENNEDELLKNGADIVVRDMAAMDMEWIEKWFNKKPRPLSEYWDRSGDKDDPDLWAAADKKGIIINPCYVQAAGALFSGGKDPVFFFDYDGTLTPIVDRPELAVISDEMKRTVKALSEKYTVAVVSGRAREDVEKMLGIPGIFYAGSHGFDISGPGISMVLPEAEKFIPLISEVTAQLKKELGDIRGILVEEKRTAVAVHYRLVREEDLPGIRDLLESTVREHASLMLMRGKKVFEIMPDIGWDKGKAVRWIMEAVNIPWDGFFVIYAGDDTTDEFAFRAVRTRGTGILVSGEDRVSAADFRVSSTDEVKALIERAIKGS